MAQANSAEPAGFWSQDVSVLLRQLQSQTEGLDEAEASSRLAQNYPACGPNPHAGRPSGYL